MFSYRLSHMDPPVLAHQAKFKDPKLCVDTGCRLRDLPRRTNCVYESRESMLSICLDDEIEGLNVSSCRF